MLDTSIGTDDRLFNLMVECARFRDHLYFCSDATAAKRLGVSRRTILRARSRLEASGRIVREERKIGRAVVYSFPIGVRRKPRVTQRFSGSRKPKSKRTTSSSARAGARRSFGRRRRWRIEMGEVVGFDGGLPDKPKATIGQALFAAVMDELAEQGVTAIPRSLVATSVRHGTAALNDGVQPEIVLAGCLTALAQGKPQFTAHIIGDICFAKAGALMTPAEYRQLLSLENRKNNAAVTSVREAIAGHQRRAIEKGENDE